MRVTVRVQGSFAFIMGVLYAPPVGGAKEQRNEPNTNIPQT